MIEINVKATCQSQLEFDFSNCCPERMDCEQTSVLGKCETDVSVSNNLIALSSEEEWAFAKEATSITDFLDDFLQVYAKHLLEKLSASDERFAHHPLTKDLTKEQAEKLMPCKNGQERSHAVCDNCPLNPQRDMDYNPNNYDANGNFIV
jgi:hypothetical protein